MNFKLQVENTKKYNLKHCSMGRCCNVDEILRLRETLQRILDFSLEDKKSTDSEQMIAIAQKALYNNKG